MNASYNHLTFDYIGRISLRLGCPNFTYPPAVATPKEGASRSLFYPNEAIFSAHPRYRYVLVLQRIIYPTHREYSFKTFDVYLLQNADDEHPRTQRF